MVQWTVFCSRRNQILLILPLLAIGATLRFTHNSGYRTVIVVNSEEASPVSVKPRPPAEPAQSGGNKEETEKSSQDIWLESQDDWLQRRQALLRESSPAKVYMFAYMRGGSSLGGMLYDKDPEGVLWYEPLDQFFMAYYGAPRWGLPIDQCYHRNGTRRVIHDLERSLFRNYITNMLTCKYKNLPLETFTHSDFIGQSRAMRFMNSCLRSSSNQCKSFIKDYCGSKDKHYRDVGKGWENKCPHIIEMVKDLKPSKYSKDLDKTIRDRLNLAGSAVNLEKFVQHYQCVEKARPKMNSCLPNAIKKCQESRVHAVEVLRSNMEALDDVIRDVPDMYVVYYVRDPRAVASSVRTTRLRTVPTSSFLQEAQVVCSKMRKDIEEYEKLDAKYPGVFLTTKYEELVTDPIEFGDRIYKHLGFRNSTKEWGEFSKKALHASSGGGVFGVMRKDGTASIAKWRKGLTPDVIEAVNKECKDVLEKLHYDI